MSDYFLKKGIYVDDSSSVILTITKVDLSSDLRHAKVFFTLIDNSSQSKIVEFLNQNSNLYKYVVGKKIRTKNIPNIRFIYDKMFGLNFKVNS